MNTLNNTAAMTQTNGAVVNANAVAITVEALNILAKRKGHTAANVAMLLELGVTAEAIVAKYNAMADVTETVVAKPVVVTAKTNETPEQELTRLRAENARLVAAKQGKASLKMSVAGTNDAGQVTKGGSLCISGIRRFPFTFDYTDVVTIFGDPFVAGSKGLVDEIKAFAKANRSQFRSKPVK